MSMDAKPTTNIDVVIPSLSVDLFHNMIRNCISSLRASEPDIVFNVILVESSPKVFDFGQDKTLKFDLPKFNFHHAINQGLAAASSDWVVVANNDLLFSKGWMSEILEIKKNQPFYQSFSPWEPTVSPKFFDGLCDLYEGYEVGRHITGWCLVFERKILEKITLSEEIDYWFSDNNYADELLRNEIRHALVTKANVKHLCQQTTNRIQNRREMTVGQAAKYQKIKLKK